MLTEEDAQPASVGGCRFGIKGAEQGWLLTRTPRNTYNFVLGSFFVQFQKFTEG